MDQSVTPSASIATAESAGDSTDEALQELRTRVRGSNINEKTLLATDYLNHFNEFVMLLDLIPDMPDCLDDARAWEPKGYKEHFQDSLFSDKDLTVEAYEFELSPPEFREEFESTVDMINALIPRVLDRIKKAVDSGDTERTSHECSKTSQLLQSLMDVVSAVINGEKPTIDQDGIDALIDS
jgi:hypothetical protein